MSKLPPCYGQTAENVSAWLKGNIAVGEMVAVRSSHGPVLSYQLAIVTRIGKDCFDLDRAERGIGSTFNYTGSNRSHPKGQTRLVMPTLAVMAACDGLADRGVGYGASTV